MGGNIAWPLEEHSLALYRMASEYARAMGVILADTKFEFGIIDGKISVIDELLTPDSSRYWDANIYEAGKSQPSFDKQIIRDWLIESRVEPRAARPGTARQHCAADNRQVSRRVSATYVEGTRPVSIGRIVGSALIAVAAAIMLYTIIGAVSIVWGVAQFDEMPITVKLFLPVIFVTLAGTLGVMAFQRMRRHSHSNTAGNSAQN